MKDISDKVSRTWRKLDSELYKIGKTVEILQPLSWPEGVMHDFLESVRKRKIKLPEPPKKEFDFSEKLSKLAEIRKKASGSHPIPEYIKRTARAYETALLMLESSGTKRFTELSRRLYGTTDRLRDSAAKQVLTISKRFLKSFGRFREEKLIPPESVCILPGFVAAEMRKEATRVFPDRDIKIEIRDDFPSKAVANAKGVKIRSGTCFADFDISQLINHELLVHTLTLLNGRAQPFKSLGLSSPRVTVTQEGLAVFSEFVTNSIDAARLARLSARVMGIDRALKGADFIEVFRFFKSLGQDNQEAYFSTKRIFRGGRPEGGVVFTKDLVYMKGLVEVYRFLIDAFENEQFDYPLILFAGRMTTRDVEEFAPIYNTKHFLLPRYLPDWVKHRATLLTYLLSFSAFRSLGEES